ncbi:VgrG-related protein [Desulfocurvus sp. DL9XJH121]
MIRTILSGLRTIPLPPVVRDGFAPLSRATVLVGRLAAREMRAGLLRCWGFLVPPAARFPVALLAYLLLVFSLEVVFLRTFSPMTEPDPPVRAHPAALALDTQGLDTVMLAAALPSAFSFHARPGLLLGCTEAALAEAPETWNDFQKHPLLSLDQDLLDASSNAPFDSVRQAVVHSSVRMPVDRLALHPLDKTGFLAGDTRRFRRLFARVDTPGGGSLHADALPKSAIAPPLTRLDKLRLKQARTSGLGELCALFESGVRGIFAVGYDIKGGTSYGKYQISSRKGAMQNFLSYLDVRAPSWAMRLRASGRSNTGGTDGAMPREWKRIAREHPRPFERLQDEFIQTRYYAASLNEMRKRAGLDLENHPEAIKEVLWSTAVQHGPSGGASIFIKACLRAKTRTDKPYAAILEEVFREREKRLEKCPPQQRSALRERLRQEKEMALNRLRVERGTRTTEVASLNTFM